MKKKSIFFMFSFLLLIAGTLSPVANRCIAQSINISPGARLNAYGNISLAIDNGGIINRGIINLDSATVSFTGTNAISTINGSGKWIVNRIIINKADGKVQLAQPITILQELQFIQGNIELNKQTIILDKNAVITGESNLAGITGTLGGKVEITVQLLAGQTVNPGNIGLQITPVFSLGTTTITRGHQVQYSKTLGRSINRYYNIIPSKGTVFRAKIRFNYLDREMNTLTETNLQLYNSIDSGKVWMRRGYSTRNPSDNSLEMINLIVPGYFTLSTPDIFKREIIPPVAERFSFQLLPNPVHDQGMLKISIPENESAEIAVVNMEGKTMIRKAVILTAGINSVSISTKGFAGGSYIAIVKFKNGESKQISFIKN
ncbi:T9SS type A sorting domain-containing protein [Pollutibacter soli]|uniref:T9SS type A sorting domain-containing protein n=1 Tax=Pollutibacter soli TaxID=3034157 RepID=UPI003013A2EA